MIVIPMAGRSRRFFEAGYDRPKYMLPLGGRFAGATLFGACVGSFRALFDVERFLFVHLDAPEVRAFVERELAGLGLSGDRFALAALPDVTAGQAETVFLGLAAAGVADAEPLTVFNIDTIRPGFIPPREIDGADGYLEVVEAEGEHWSFVGPGEGDRVRLVTEKRRISTLCSTGLYHFSRVGLFREAYAEDAARDPATLQGGERYVAPLYNALIARGRDIRWRRIGRDEVVFVGTPEEYAALRGGP